MASLKDIAADLGVSVSLVSKVLNGRLGTTGVREELCQAIRDRAAELGYRKNVSAVALRKGRHDVIGVFIHRLGMVGSGICEELLDGVCSEARRSHQKLLLNFFETDEEFYELCAIAHPSTMDGLVVGGIFHPEIVKTLRRTREGGVPVVTLYDVPCHASLPNVGIDQVAVMHMATLHLLDRGCRRIAHIRNRPDRFRGYRAALAERGVPMRKKRVFEADIDEFSHVTGERAVRHFLRSGIAFDGLVAQSDQEAMGALHTLVRSGLDVPRDVRIVGVDNAPYCEFSRVPLTSVSQNYRKRGRVALRMILEAEKGRPVESVQVDPSLHVRESSR